MILYLDTYQVFNMRDVTDNDLRHTHTHISSQGLKAGAVRGGLEGEGVEEGK